MNPATIIIALGSNRRHGRHGAPAGVVHAAVAALSEAGLALQDVSAVLTTRAVGPAGRDFANAVAIANTALPPPAILALLKRIEADFGRRGGRRWGARVLDLDLLAWGDGVWPSRLCWAKTRGLAVPHRALHKRDFVLLPMLDVAAEWRHPVLGLTARQMLAQLRRTKTKVDPRVPDP